jgi:hypothetical protein
MSPFLHNAVRSCTSFFGFVFDLMGDAFRFFRLSIRSHFALSAEVLFLRKQLAFYEERETQPRRLTNAARLSLVLWSRLFDWKNALVLVKPETLIGWHRRGFQLFWRWKSRVGRPRLPENIRKLIVRMALKNPTWGQARVAAELSVKLGIYVSPRTVRAYWPPESGSRGPHRTSSQHWKATLAGLQVPSICSETHELGEELVGSYLYQVHLYHWLESNDYGRFLSDNDL